MAPAPTPEDREWMRRAVELAWRGWGRVHPNPLVGAVVVRDGERIAEGWHAQYGGPHAEAVALAAAGERARGATLYTTLEPCAHHGKTPPCAAAIEAAGIARVVYGARDPHPEAGGGADRLARAGVEVVGGVEADAVRAQNAAFFHVVERGSVYVALKYALSLDARLGAAPGRATPVTGEAARAETHRLRAGFDAIMVGSRTALVDDPLLTVRGDIVPRVPPVRIVLDTEARLPLASRLAATAAETPTWVVCAEDAPPERRSALEAAGVRVLSAPRGPGGLALDAVLSALWEAGIRSVLCEGGGTLGSALLAEDRVARLYLFFAPKLYGPDGPPAFTSPLSAAATDAWVRTDLRELGQDVLLVLDRAW
jgi:diaminohydroxyphosphoribosylaminopyrimidine deaminase/5-amino-6-(5-phosphoribosylamino)uracil reductase|nr:MAG: bifunctional diaminohydroxyphosphoribosylaminopyrimidine deaminase/5-amino-6-(5-phosphoribosylamino)uracil reductase RibD [bacterium]